MTVKYKGIISVILTITLILSVAPVSFAEAANNPVFYLTFETLEGGRIQNFASEKCDISLVNVVADKISTVYHSFLFIDGESLYVNLIITYKDSRFKL